jgi:hypothetical protein
MESTAFFEKKINLTPGDFNEVKKQSIDSILETKAKQVIENKCSEQGFVLSGSIKLLSRSMGYFESARFTGDAVYYLKLEGKVIYPADGVRVIGEVIRKNKMGLYVNYRDAIRVQVPRDLHIGSEEYEDVEVGDSVEVELKRSKFQINDPYILASAMFITKHAKDTPPSVADRIDEEGEGEGDKDGGEEESENGSVAESPADSENEAEEGEEGEEGEESLSQGEEEEEEGGEEEEEEGGEEEEEEEEA